MIEELMKTGMFELHGNPDGSYVIKPIEWVEFNDKPDPLVEALLYQELKENVKVPWAAIEKKYDYVAMDADGTWHLYEGKPSRGTSEWMSVLDNYRVITLPKVSDWKNSLIYRYD